MSEMPQPFLFSDTKFDAALHFAHPNWSGVVTVDLFEERLVPVVNPQYFDISKLNTPEEFLSLPLLHKASRPEAWRHWLELGGCSNHSSALGMRFDMYGMVIEAARSGLGAGLVPRIYVHNEIHRRDLAVPIDLELRHEKQYCFVYPQHKQDSPLVMAFKDWLLEIKTEFESGAQ